MLWMFGFTVKKGVSLLLNLSDLTGGVLAGFFATWRGVVLFTALGDLVVDFFVGMLAV